MKIHLDVRLFQLLNVLAQLKSGHSLIRLCSILAGNGRMGFSSIGYGASGRLLSLSDTFHGEHKTVCASMMGLLVI